MCLRKYNFYCTGSKKAHNCTTQFCPYFLYQMLSILKVNYKIQQDFISNHKYSIPFTSTIFTKISTAHYMQIFYISFYSNWMKNVENKNTITFTLLAEELLSMHQIFIKCETAQPHYMEIFSEFYTNHSIHTEITRRNSFMPVSKM